MKPLLTGRSRIFQLWQKFGKLMIQRLIFHLKSSKSLSEHQYGFPDGRSVESAIRALTDKIQTAKRVSKHVMRLSLDIKGAVDNLEHKETLESSDWKEKKSYSFYWKICKLLFYHHREEPQGNRNMGLTGLMQWCSIVKFIIRGDLPA
ncbi:hypothetical protein AVEN_45971-1 [Araneus ventricosus]|uniref:Uncharacterized protein n=1 Tax=Araneus ventricosus TaxID=182803 RepID=A0A4Y2U420_ARAVE|nr:hypothetical protein AVEN_45971-1 [Araneus ventricosus]